MPRGFIDQLLDLPTLRSVRLDDARFIAGVGRRRPEELDASSQALRTV
jgi:hypothetical protein